MINGKLDQAKVCLPISDLILLTNDSLMQQLKMMVLAQEEGKYNLAFNHMLNVFHMLCFISDNNKATDKLKNYDQNDIVDYLTTKSASIDEINFVMSFFDRRNKNNISHPGEELMENWVVNETEYYSYYQQLYKLIERKIVYWNRPLCWRECVTCDHVGIAALQERHELQTRASENPKQNTAKLLQQVDIQYSFATTIVNNAVILPVLLLSYQVGYYAHARL